MTGKTPVLISDSLVAPDDVINIRNATIHFTHRTAANQLSSTASAANASLQLANYSQSPPLRPLTSHLATKLNAKEHFFQFIKEDNIADVENLILQDEQLANVVDSHGDTPLIVACRMGLSSMCHLLIKHNAQVGMKGSHTRNALHNAAVEGHVNVVDLLLKTAIPIDRQDADGNTALHLAARRGHSQVCKMLLDIGAAPHLKGCPRTGYTALHLAVLSGDLKTVELFLIFKHLLNTKSQNRSTPLMVAAEFGHSQEICIALLMANVQRDAVDENGWDAARIAMCNGNSEIAALIKTPFLDKQSFLSRTANLALLLSTKKQEPGPTSKWQDTGANKPQSKQSAIAATYGAAKSQSKQKTEIYKTYHTTQKSYNSQPQQQPKVAQQKLIDTPANKMKSPMIKKVNAVAAARSFSSPDQTSAAKRPEQSSQYKRNALPANVRATVEGMKHLKIANVTSTIMS